MTVILNLNPEMEKGLMARAQARGISLDDYIRELVAREAGVPAAPEPPPAGKRFDNLSDFLLNSPFAGANLDLERSKDFPRSGAELVAAMQSSPYREVDLERASHRAPVRGVTF